MDRNVTDNEFSSNTDGEDLESSLTKTVLKLEEIDKNLYRSTHLWKPVGGRGVFGGQVVGQALSAAGQTVTDDLHVHSLHCYFLQAGKDDHPIVYHVDRNRDGESFSSRTVKASQHGEIIFTMLVSYHKHEISQIHYQHDFPEVPRPHELSDYGDLLRQALDSERLSERRKVRIRHVLAHEIPLEVRPVDPLKYLRLAANATAPKTMFWVKAKGHIGVRDNNLHRCVAAYISDWAFLGVALIPFPRFRPEMIASLDHSMWFHSTFRTDEWMLYECENTRSSGARSLVLGRLWKQDGTLAVSVAQEGVVRGTLPPSKL